MLLFGFSTIVLLTGIYYHFNTGNALFKISQIETSDYKYLPNYHIEKSILLIRLTIGPWQTFVGQGFYPVVIAAGILITKCFSKGTKFLIYQFYPLAFFILLLIGLYFPFSISPFHPLKSECRQFLFLLPWAAAICTNYLYILFRPTQKNDKLFWIFPVLLVCCMMSTRNKWEWMIYLLTTILFSFRYILEMKRSFSIYLISSIFFLSVLEIIFFNFSPWFSEMQVLEKRIPDNCFYFADHDNMMHYELLRKFDFKKSSFFNLEKDPFFILDNYTSSPNDHPFKPGWLICNRAYTIRSGKFFSEIDSLTSLNLFSRTIKFPHINAYFIEDRKKLNIIQRLVLLDQ